MIASMLAQFDQIHEVTLLYPAQLRGLRARTVLSEMSPLQHQRAEALDLARHRSA